MILQQFFQAYSFGEIMPVVNDMFPGTKKFSKQLEQGYRMMLNMRPVFSKKVIRYSLRQDPESKDTYIGADDHEFNAPWEVCLGKQVVRERGVDLSDVELAANCLVNLCLQGRYPKDFEEAHQELMKG